MSDALPHLLVVDDDTRLRGLLRKYLSDRGYRVTAAADAAEARARLQGLSFDLLILDLMLPGESGLELARDLRKSSSVPILMLTAMGEAADRIAGLQSGADDYLPKPFEPEELLLRIGSILRRVTAPPAAPMLVRFGAFSFDPAKGELLRDGRAIALTSGEAALLKIFARTPGVTISRADLNRQTGGGEGRAVDVQITRLRRKIEANPKTPRYLQTVWGEGYVLWAD
ncbi:MAG TPA: response regulator [Candidatus Sulfotelmatobacter sp.]|nr:response regulator [Candidatus Sulfotelmatobacter sp.]